MRYDFHSHSYYSDGLLSPMELVERGEARGVELLALSDHDSISGLKHAREHIIANNLTIRLVDAVEISAHSDFGEIHIVGLDINANNNKLTQLLERQKDKRWQRAREFELKLQKLQIFGVYDYLQENCKEIVTRSHIARALIHLGHAKDNNQAFKKYLGKKGKIKVPSDWASMEEVISCIQTAGGRAILAHPTRYPMSNRRLTYLIEEFAIAKGDAIELSYPSLNPDKKAWLEVQRSKHSLLASGGSDFHYPNLKWTDLGRFPPIENCVPHVLTALMAGLQ